MKTPVSPRVFKAAAAAVLMIAISTFSHAIRPTQRLSDRLPPLELSTMVPTRFGVWSEYKSAAYVVNPVGQQAVDLLYSQTLSRVYVDAEGHRVMLSIAYGGDQSDATSMHLPEVCYPAQGFMMRSSSSGSLSTATRQLPIKRLVMEHGRRTEPITYWLVIGDQVATSTLGHKRIQMGYNIRGLIPDGLIFRVSTIDTDTDRAFAVQQRFLRDLVDALPEPARVRLAGAAPGHS